MKCPILIRFAVVGCVFHSVALFGMTTNTWVAGSTDWDSPDSYLEKSVPGEGDCVFVPAGVTATVEVVSADVAGLADFSVFSNLGSVILESPTSALAVDLADGISLTNDCMIRSRYIASGVIVKRGAGMLEFGSQSTTGYDVDIMVEEGTLVFPQKVGSQFAVRRVTVAEGATLITAVDEARGTSIAAGQTKVSELWGAGTVSNRVGGKVLNVRLNETSHSVFSGVIGRGVRLHLTEPSRLDLMGESSTFTVSPSITGGMTLGFKSMGMSGTPSSLGTSDTMYWRGAGTFLYLGDGETSDRDLKSWTTVDAPLVFDGGPNGGLTLTGNISCHVSGGESSCGMYRLELTGSNAVPCVVAGGMPTWTLFGTNYNFHVIKSGTGTWRFTDVARTHAGGFTVKEGTLQYDSLKDRGSACSLGTSTNTMECYSGLIDESKRVEWAFALGAADTAGKFEYTGSKNVWCYTRPLLMCGSGTVSVTDGNVRFRFANVSADDGVDATLTLAGPIPRDGEGGAS